MKHSNKGFSFIEILISCAILIVLATVGITYSDNMKDKSNNSKVKTELSTLENSFTLYYDDVKVPILPSGNQKFFNKDSSYAHDSIGAFGVSGFATETTLPKKFINYLPVDPKSNQYYAYASTFGSGEFEVAGVIKYNKNYQALVHGTYKGNSSIPNLIREYNGPNFVFNTSMDFLPYNPEERILTAKIHNFTGSVLINNTIYSKEELNDLDLFEGDTIKVGTGEFAEIFFSDGSQSTLGDSDVESQLTLANMRFPEEYNLTTQIKLALSVGSLWTKASKMSEKSQFEVYTIDSVAAVRGTVFGVRRANNETNTVVLEGTVEVNKIISGGGVGVSFEDLKNGLSGGNPNFLTIPLGNGLIEVPKGNSYSGISVNTFTSSMGIASTGAILTLPTSDTKEKIIENAGNINSNIQLKILKLDTGAKKVELELTPTLKTATQLFVTGTGYTAQSFFDGTKIIITNLAEKNTIKLCDTLNCTAELQVNLENQVSFTEPEIKNMIDNVTVPEVPETCVGGIKAQGTCGENLMGNDWEVSHFAPFDVQGDLNMYRKNASIVPVMSGGILSNSCYFKFYDDAFSKFYNTACSDANDYVTRMTSFTNIFVKENSWLDIKDGFKGIVLDNHNNDDFLKYDFTNEGISGDSVLEFQVRGADLYKTGALYSLFQTTDVKVFLNSTQQIILQHRGGSWFSKISIPTSTLETNKNYIVQIGYLDGKNFIKILGTGIEGVYNTGKPFLNDWVNIGNDANTRQWNGVLDYVKIYQKTE